mmetsp:Transcript_14036/g.26294  ORF Transcript_14036/g.26294 Transcript_14036/m.26294 type:complete len:168 (+) Transcript_14036:976-1479(+)
MINLQKLLLAKASRPPQVENSPRRIRVLRDIEEFQSENIKEATLRPLNDDEQFIFRVTLKGPRDSLYAGHVFELRLEFPESYPHYPPKLKFVSPIFHPNISSDGHISLNVLYMDWKPVLSLSVVIVGVFVLLSVPNPIDCINYEAAQFYMHDIEEYKKQVESRMTRE